jgi:rRNA pseudouridine-1189 N-methylase Emg1 (Nep1/Mra1 family)
MPILSMPKSQMRYIQTLQQEVHNTQEALAENEARGKDNKRRLLLLRNMDPVPCEQTTCSPSQRERWDIVHALFDVSDGLA